MDYTNPVLHILLEAALPFYWRVVMVKGMPKPVISSPSSLNALLTSHWPEQISSNKYLTYYDG